MTDTPAAQQIDDIINLYSGWKGETIARIRAIIMATDPEVVEEVKWKMRTRPEGLPVWYHNGIICRTETFKDNIKLVFSKGAQMKALQQLFNARLEASTDRAIEYHEGDAVDEANLQTLLREAIRLNTVN